MRTLIATALFILGATAANAAILDLTTPGSFGTINGAIFQQTDEQPTGTGFIDSFVRIRARGSEEGYNTSGRPVPFDELTNLTFTHNLQLSDLTTVEGYAAFLLDINENLGGVNEFLTLNMLQIYLSPTPSQNTTNVASLGTLVYDLGNNSIELDASLNSGSGSGDMLAYFSESLFSSFPPSTYLYLYSQFGLPGSSSSDGFEEWATFEGAPAPIPEPGTMVLLGFGLLGVAVCSKRRMIKE